MVVVERSAVKIRPTVEQIQTASHKPFKYLYNVKSSQLLGFYVCSHCSQAAIRRLVGSFQFFRKQWKQI